MNKPIHIIYVPGLGDDKVTGQRRAISTWRFWGVRSELLQMNWADKETWVKKSARLIKSIDSAADEGYAVALVGASAGGAAVINAFAKRKDKICAVVLLSGKILYPEAIGANVRKNNPAFITASQQCQASIRTLNEADLSRVLSRFALRDDVVPERDSRLSGAVNQRILSVGHSVTIATQLVFGAPSFISFIKRQARNSGKSASATL
jgi:pimeloyl-ACP methyl ester carboxylesterase